MNWQHLKAFVWLRWRLMANQARRAGSLNAAITVIFSVVVAVTAAPLFFGCFALGTYLIPKAAPAHLMYAWDGVILAFSLVWGVGLITELQRNDPLALSKFLHLPVSVNAAFLINYFSSLARLSLITFVPLMLGFALALIYVKGFEQLAVLPSLVAFLLMITALTYQFQGWLASLVNNPRKRRTVVVAVTMGFVLIFQLPNLVNLYFLPQQTQRQTARSRAMIEEFAKLRQSLSSGEIDNEGFAKRQQEITDRNQAETRNASLEDSRRIERTVELANMVLPIGWLPVGVKLAAQGQVWPSLLGMSAMTLIGSLSLWRAYRTTVRQYQGSATNRERKAPTVRASSEPLASGNRLEGKIPGCSEPVTVVALGSFLSLLRSPEAKISLLSPLILGAVFGTMLLRGGSMIPETVRPLLGLAAIAFVNFGLVQLMSNQFGFDRDGFRVFVLCSASRGDILLGKNLSFVPAAVGLSAILVAGVFILSPLRVDHALALIPQSVTMFLLFCMMANLFSICLPVYMVAGSLKPAHPKLATVLLQLLLFLILFPLTQGLAAIPLGIEAATQALGWGRGVPISLLLSLAECVVAILLYRYSLGWLGRLLQSREQRILETITNRAV